MKQNVTIATHTDGKTSLVHGPDVPFVEQRDTVHGFRENGLPEGVERVELWTRHCVKFAHDKLGRLAHEKLAADRAHPQGPRAGDLPGGQFVSCGRCAAPHVSTPSCARPHFLP